MHEEDYNPGINYECVGREKTTQESGQPKRDDDGELAAYRKVKLQGQIYY